MGWRSADLRNAERPPSRDAGSRGRRPNESGWPLRRRCRTVGTGPRNSSRPQRVAWPSSGAVATHVVPHTASDSALSVRLPGVPTSPDRSPRSGRWAPLNRALPVLCSATRRSTGTGTWTRGSGSTLPARSASPSPTVAASTAVALPAPATAPGPAQLALGLPGLAPVDLPALAIAPEWKDQQRLWGHRLHPMCSYLASFPAALAHAFIARYSRPGDVVLDPFSGRGTTPLQACAEGRIGVGNDLNPFAHLLTAAKVEPASEAETRIRLTALRLRWAGEADAWFRLALEVLGAAGPDGARVPPARKRSPAGRHGGAGEPVPVEVALSFHPRTFAQLLLRPLGASGSTSGSTASWPPRSPASSTARARRTSPRSCRTRSAWLRATSASSSPGPASARPSATSSTASGRSSAGSTASRSRRSAGSPCSATRATPASGRRPPSASGACRTGPGSS